MLHHHHHPLRPLVPAPAGSMVGALMVDGYGDGLVVECASEDTDYLRTTAFGLLQVGGTRGCG